MGKGTFGRSRLLDAMNASGGLHVTENNQIFETGRGKLTMVLVRKTRRTGSSQGCLSDLDARARRRLFGAPVKLRLRSNK